MLYLFFLYYYKNKKEEENNKMMQGSKGSQRRSYSFFQVHNLRQNYTFSRQMQLITEVFERVIRIIFKIRVCHNYIHLNQSSKKICWMKKTKQ